MSGGEEHTSRIAIDGDRGEETPQTTSQDEQGPAEELLEKMGDPDGTAGAVGTMPADSQDEVTIHVTEEEIKDFD